jgi:hexosaminidase
MAELGLKSEGEIQGWFNREIGALINERGRRLIGWDEILECPLPDGATVMSWRGEKGGIEAANKGYDVVMAPGSHTYFDHYQAEPTADEPLAIGGYLPTEKVYAYEPVPGGVAEDRRHHVLGAQAQLWTEYIPTAEHLEYMAFPRACALAEVVWADAGNRSYEDFLRRLGPHRRRLEAMDVNSHPRP